MGHQMLALQPVEQLCHSPSQRPQSTSVPTASMALGRRLHHPKRAGTPLRLPRRTPNPLRSLRSIAAQPLQSRKSLVPAFCPLRGRAANRARALPPLLIPLLLPLPLLLLLSVLLPLPELTALGMPPTTRRGAPLLTWIRCTLRASSTSSSGSASLKSTCRALTSSSLRGQRARAACACWSLGARTRSSGSRAASCGRSCGISDVESTALSSSFSRTSMTTCPPPKP
mmetsp:Transcript_24114/g.61630  ORF Transcript_24114/g.61630 Transcript_24114/m.61630 type:complete len:227 (+) Transcript_24114:306-986(+)